MLLTKDTLPQYDEWISAIAADGGVALFDKALDWTSFDVVAKLRGITRIKKIGHAGTLDPLATGLLIICLGKATKSITQFQDQHKSYTAVIKLGATTITDDSEAPEDNVMPIEYITEQAIREAVKAFVGTIEQIPPMFSAIKKNGTPLYKLARKGQEVERIARVVTIHDILIEQINMPFVTVRVDCTKGTYIRSLARDIGARLGCGAYLSALRRTSIGAYSVNDAITITDLADYVANKKSTDPFL